MIEEPPLGKDGFHTLSDEWTEARPGAFGLLVNRPGAALYLMEGDSEAGSARVDALARARIGAAAGCGAPSAGKLPCYFLPATAASGRRSLANWLRLPRAASQLVVAKDFEVCVGVGVPVRLVRPCKGCGVWVMGCVGARRYCCIPAPAWRPIPPLSPTMSGHRGKVHPAHR